MLPAARAALLEQLEQVGNPSSIHAAGRRARRVVEEARERLAAAIGAHRSEVIFTSGGTEADNLAVKGAYAARVGADPTRRRVVVSGVEHHAVLDGAEHLARTANATVDFVEPDAGGAICPDALAHVLGDGADVAVASLVWANNEIGTISPMVELAAVARERGVTLHSDAVQAVGHIPVDFAASGLDLMTLTGHKLGGPIGAGALIARRDATLEPLLHGGGQERGVRSGTVDAPAVWALASAVEESVANLTAESVRLITLRDRLIHGALALDLDVRVTGHWTPGSAADRLPGNVHLRVPGADGDSLLFLLDEAEIACATGSACSAGVPRPSHVVLALGIPEADAHGSLRLTLGHTSTEADVDAALAALPTAIERARRAKGAS